MLESDEEDTEDPNDPGGDPPLIENEVRDIPDENISIPTGHTFTGLLDKRKLIWKKEPWNLMNLKLNFKAVLI